MFPEKDMMVALCRDSTDPSAGACRWLWITEELTDNPGLSKLTLWCDCSECLSGTSSVCCGKGKEQLCHREEMLFFSDMALLLRFTEQFTGISQTAWTCQIFCCGQIQIFPINMAIK